MSTRGIVGFRIHGKDYLTYNHAGSFPEGLGNDLIQEIKQLFSEYKLSYKKFLTELRKKVEKIELVSYQGRVPAYLMTDPKYLNYNNYDVGGTGYHSFDQLLKEAQGSFIPWLKKDPITHMVDSHLFMGASLYCEWAYILNLDTGKFEVYKGFNENRGAPGRYAHKKDREKSSYCGVKLIDSISIKKLIWGNSNKYTKKWSKYDRYSK